MPHRSGHHLLCRDTNDLLASLVQARGFQPVQVFTGAEALEAVARDAPDLILLDLFLPDIDAVSEFCDRLRPENEPDSDRDGDRRSTMLTISKGRRCGSRQRIFDQANHSRSTKSADQRRFAQLSNIRARRHDLATTS